MSQDATLLRGSEEKEKPESVKRKQGKEENERRGVEGERRSSDQWAGAEESGLRGPGLAMPTSVLEQKKRKEKKNCPNSSTMAKAKTNKSSFFIWFSPRPLLRYSQHSGFLCAWEHNSIEYKCRLVLMTALWRVKEKK